MVSVYTMWKTFSDMEEDSEEEASDGTCPSPKRKKS